MSQINKRELRVGEQKLNNQNSLMKIIEYNHADDIIIEFQDEYKTKMHTNYSAFTKGNVKNPYYPSVFGVGMKGDKYPSRIDEEKTKEYNTWIQMLRRCFDDKFALRNRGETYKNVTCCNDWLLYSNFYEWLHEQENFNRWLNNKKWCIDKDIVIKNNNIYSADTCCLVPNNVNNLFIKSNKARGDLPIGVSRCNNRYSATYENKNQCIRIGIYDTPEEAFNAYKKMKEQYIHEVAQEEYNNGNITKKCYEAMMNYNVEITD